MHGAFMSKPKVLIFAPREEPPETIKALEGMGCEIVFGNRDWQLPRTDARGCGGGSRARRGRADGHLDPPHPDQPAHHAGLAAAAHRREIHRRRRRHRHRGRDRPRRHGVPRADRIQLLRRRRNDGHLHAVAVEEGRRARRRRARRQVAHARRISPITSAAAASDGFPGQTIGLVGLGRIGTRVAQLLAPWRARIIAYDPYVPPAHFLTHGVTAVDYETLLRESDVVSFHVVLTRETRYMFGEEQLKLMKPNAIVLNTARGKVLDEKALARAIDEGRIRGAAIDAFEEEPLPMDSPLRKLGDRVLLSPHSASYTEGGELRQGVAWATRSVVTALKGGIPDNVYNREVIPRWKERFGGLVVAE